MTGTPFNDDRAGTELMLRERFESAVGGLTPDIGWLVAGGAADGHGAIRRRRIVSGVVAAAVAVIAIGSLTYASQNDLLGVKDDHATNNGVLEQLVPATPRGLAAAVMTHTSELGTPIAVWGGHGSMLGLGTTDAAVSAEFGYELDDGRKVDLYVFAVDSDAGAALSDAGDICQPHGPAGAPTVCDRISLDDGTTGVYYAFAKPGEPQALSAALLLRPDGSRVGVTESLVEPGVLPLDKAALLALLTDPLIGVSTTAAMNTAGEDIANFQIQPGGQSDSGSGSSGVGTASPRTVETQPAMPSGGSGDASSAASN